MFLCLSVSPAHSPASPPHAGSTSSAGRSRLALILPAGHCTRGSICRFLHEVGTDGKPVAPVCIDYASGRCSRGSSCKFSHDKPGGSSGRESSSRAHDRDRERERERERDRERDRSRPRDGPRQRGPDTDRRRDESDRGRPRDRDMDRPRSDAAKRPRVSDCYIVLTSPQMAARFIFGSGAGGQLRAEPFMLCRILFLII